MVHKSTLWNAEGMQMPTMKNYVKLTSLQPVWDKIILGFHQWLIKNKLDIFKQSLIMSFREKLKIDGRYYSNGLELKY